MSPLLVIPTLGESPHLPAAVASAAALPRWRVVLVAPAARCAGLRAAFPRCEVVPEAAPGLYAAVNTGLRAGADWEWGAYLNDDDLVNAAAGRVPSAETDIAYGRVDYIGPDGRRLGSFPVEPSPRRLPALLAAGIPALTPQGTVISRRAFAALGGFDPGLRYCADFDFWLRASQRGLRFEFRPEVAGAFRLRPGQLSGQRAAADAELARVCAPARARFGRPALVLARLSFRLRHLALIWERRRLTGHWRSRALFTPPAP